MRKPHLLRSFEIYGRHNSAFGPSVGMSPTVEVRQLSREDKMIAEVVRLGSRGGAQIS
jgi:hypothetical protein